MTTYPLIYATNDATILPQGAADLLDGAMPTIKFTSPDGNSKFTLCGPEAPWPGIQDGILLVDGLSGVTPGFKHIDLKGARQPGVTWTYTMYDTCNLTMRLQAHATTPQGMSRLVSEWIGAWNPNLQGSLEYWTVDRGYWWFPAGASRGRIRSQLPRLVLHQEFTQKIRNDLAFWLGVPWTDTFRVTRRGGPARAPAGCSWATSVTRTAGPPSCATREPKTGPRSVSPTAPARQR
ncbi:hypothetical protein [Mycobacterium botniense]|uniref:Uncharacterized protein n=1 Tax=Mycobacterium botniense TaxID=84962 RepID=A0A7I9XY34_9MYCO|nr:hypothetical protein [Mycobacterium botniense]GFG74711.1 hypothetical protein MBOT_20760 [Mycobacterium botniense]